MTSIAEQADRLSLGGKINLIVMASCGAALSIAAGVHITNEIVDFRPQLEAENRKLAQVVSANVSAAVLFNDIEAMDENLDAFSLIPEVYAAEIRNEDGAMLARYVAKDRGEASQATETALSGSFRIATPITVRDDRVGTLELVIGLDSLKEAILNYVIVAAVALLFSLVPALGVIRVLKPTVLKPLNRLSETMDSITATQDYVARVDNMVNDEFGHLAKRFNAMLEEIQRRDRRLAQAAADMTEAKEFAEAANATKTKFIANMSHELRTPLQAIIGYSEIVIDDLEDVGQDDQVLDLRRILAAAQHLLGLINDVLDVAKIEAGKFELHSTLTDMRQLIEDAVGSVRPAATKNGNALFCRIDDDVGTMLCDAIRFRQCLLNLLSNACKFTKNGRIELRASIEKSAAEATLNVEIEDTGIGIAPDKLAYLFEPFVQVDNSMTRSHGGSGLGLAITRDIVEMMGGCIRVFSASGEGSVFSIKVPCGAGSPSFNQSGDHRHADDRTDRREILIIEDAEDSALLLKRWLSPAGFDIVIRGDGVAGIEAVETLHPDLVILDVVLPDMTGWSVLQKLIDGSDERFIPVIMLTVDEDRARALASGACELITKPVQKSRLVEIVEAHIAAPPARILLKAALDRPGPLAAALEAAGHSVEQNESGQPTPTSEEVADFDCVVIDTSLLGGAEFIAPNLEKNEAIGANVILCCFGKLPAPHTLEINNPNYRVATSLSELLVAVRRAKLVARA